MPRLANAAMRWNAPCVAAGKAKGMVLYTLYLWLRRTRRDRLEAQRKRACMVMLTVLSLIFLESRFPQIALDTWVQTTGMAASNTRALTASLVQAQDDVPR